MKVILMINTIHQGTSASFDDLNFVFVDYTTNFSSLDAQSQKALEDASSVTFIPENGADEPCKAMSIEATNARVALPHDVIPHAGLSAATLVEFLTRLSSGNEWSISLINGAPRELAKNPKTSLFGCALEILLHDLFQGRLPYQYEPKEGHVGAGAIPSSIISTALCSALSLWNIEDLFPQLPWSESEQESALLAYHKLTASFLKLRDTTSALECLSCSEKLGESPRALALRAISALREGRTLGAVAHLISSLQGYELSTNNSHIEVEVFKTSRSNEVERLLQKGLEALDRAENTMAAASFGQAVQKFDAFFDDEGLSEMLIPIEH